MAQMTESVEQHIKTGITTIFVIRKFYNLGERHKAKKNEIKQAFKKENLSVWDERHTVEDSDLSS